MAGAAGQLEAAGITVVLAHRRRPTTGRQEATAEACATAENLPPLPWAIAVACAVASRFAVAGVQPPATMALETARLRGRRRQAGLDRCGLMW